MIIKSKEQHPLKDFKFCPKCGSEEFVVNNFKSKRCLSCGFVYYFNASAAVACFLLNNKAEVLVARRKQEPAKGTYDLVGGFVDNYETAEEAVVREIKEETGLSVTHVEYLFSQPNIYRYSDFDVHTVDICFECKVDSFENAKAADDVAELMPIEIEKLNEHLFGFESIRKAVKQYKELKI